MKRQPLLNSRAAGLDHTPDPGNPPTDHQSPGPLFHKRAPKDEWLRGGPFVYHKKPTLSKEGAVPMISAWLFQKLPRQHRAPYFRDTRPSRGPQRHATHQFKTNDCRNFFIFKMGLCELSTSHQTNAKKKKRGSYIERSRLVFSPVAQKKKKKRKPQSSRVFLTNSNFSFLAIRAQH